MVGSENTLIVDLGCGTNKISGAVGVDNVQLPHVDIVHDLLCFPYPFESESVDEIFLNHVLEHFVFADIQKILDEVYRIIKPKSIVYIRVPHVDSIAAWLDPTHKMAFTFRSLMFIDKNAKESYYKDTHNVWDVQNISCRVTWFDWKGYSLRKLDDFFSQQLSNWLNWLLKKPGWPNGADWFVKFLPIYFVEIRWNLCKV